VKGKREGDRERTRQLFLPSLLIPLSFPPLETPNDAIDATTAAAAAAVENDGDTARSAEDIGVGSAGILSLFRALSLSPVPLSRPSNVRV
jgi:hypothetical protein